MKEQNFRELCFSDVAHLFLQVIPNLVEFDRAKARSILIFKKLNQSKKYLKKGQKMPCRIDKFDESSIFKISDLLLQAANMGMWLWATNKRADHLEILGNFGILNSCKKSYSNNMSFAIKKMLIFFKRQKK